jgi:hypothetical protein
LKIGKFLIHLAHKAIFQEKNGKPEPFGFPQNFFLSCGKSKFWERLA